VVTRLIRTPSVTSDALSELMNRHHRHFCLLCWNKRSEIWWTRLVGWLGMQDKKQRYCYCVSRDWETKSEVGMLLRCRVYGVGLVQF